MAAILFIHIAATSIPHGMHMFQPYDSHIDTIWQAYGKAICLLYGSYMAVPYSCHIDTIWQAYD